MTTTTKILPDGRLGISIGDPAQLIAALPPLFGFRPADSLIVLGLGGPGGRQVGPVARLDLPPDEHEHEVVEALLPAFAALPCQAALIVLIGRNSAHPPPSSGPPHRRLVDRLRESLAAVGAVVISALWAPEIRVGGPWLAYEGGGGTLPDDSTTVTAAVFAAEGRVTFGSREDLVRQLAPYDAEALVRRAKLLGAASAALDGQDRESTWRDGITVVRAALERVSRGDLSFSDDQVVDLALALSVSTVRDACIALACVPHMCQVAEQLWLELVRHTPPPERADSASLLCYTTYQRGEGPLAGIAVDNALEADPAHMLAGLLSQCLAHGFHPNRVRNLGRSDHVDLLCLPARGKP